MLGLGGLYLHLKLTVYRFKCATTYISAYNLHVVCF